MLHCANCDHEASAEAIVKGISSRSTPGYYIHTSGTGILTVNDGELLQPAMGHSHIKPVLMVFAVRAGREGLDSDEVYDDWENVSKVTSLPDDAWHRKVDKIVLAAPSNVNTAIVCPPTIYGAGRGPGNTVSDQCPYMASSFIKGGRAFQVGEGKNKWTEVHVHDLSALFVLLVEAAAAGGGEATWNEEGYYFAENGEFVWGDIAKEIAREVKKQGYMESDDLLSYDVEKANTMTPFGGMKWGFNSRCRAIRARKLLGWQPKGAPLLSEIPDLVHVQALKLGVAKTHAQKAAGDV